MSLFSRSCQPPYVTRLQSGALEQERWERTDVPVEYKGILEQVIGKQHDSEAGTGNQDIPSPYKLALGRIRDWLEPEPKPVVIP